jgi:hypothetical protein
MVRQLREPYFNEPSILPDNPRNNNFLHLTPMNPATSGRGALARGAKTGGFIVILLPGGSRRQYEEFPPIPGESLRLETHKI